MKSDVAIVGVGQTNYVTKRLDVSVPELAQEAVRRALQDAALTMDKVDAVVFGSGPEAFEGVNCPDKWCVDAVGALEKPFFRINTGGMTGASAAMAGHTLVASGLFDVVLVVALQRVGESSDAQQILNTIFDPIYEKDFGLNIISTIAQRAIRLMELYGYKEEHFSMISVRNHLNAFRNPHAHLKLDITLDDVLKSRVLCWPIKLLDCCPRSDGACAIVLASEEKATKITSTPAWIKGLASMSEGYFVGDRDLALPDYYSLVARKAYEMAGIDNPRAQLDVAELYGAFTVSEMIQYECLGFCERGGGGKFLEEGITEITGELPVNPSGGVQSANPIGATALVRIAEVALQVMGKAEERQIPDVKLGLATGSGGTAQFFSVMILGKKR